MFRKFVENRLVKHENGFYCSLCKKILPTKEAAFAHCDPKNAIHNQLKRAKVKEPEDEFKTTSERKLRQVVENRILQVRPGVYRCVTCDCEMQRLLNVFVHIKGNRHALNKQSSKNDTCEAKHSSNVEVGQSIRKQAELPKQNQNSSAIKGTCLQNPEQISSKEQGSSKQQDLSKDPSGLLRFCKLCNIDFYTKQNFEEHVRGRRHKSEEQSQAMLSLECILCDVKVGCRKDIFEHLQGQRHLKNSLKSSATVFTNQNRESHTTSKSLSISSVCVGNQIPFKSNSTSSSSVFICFFCENTFSKETAMTQHIAKPTNGCRVSSFLIVKPNNFDDRDLLYSCKLCDVDIPYTSYNLIQHTQGRKHQTNVEILKEKSNLNIINQNPSAKKPAQNVPKPVEKSNKHVFGFDMVSKKPDQQKTNQLLKSFDRIHMDSEERNEKKSRKPKVNNFTQNSHIINQNPTAKKPAQNVPKPVEKSNKHVFGFDMVSKKPDQQKINQLLKSFDRVHVDSEERNEKESRKPKANNFTQNSNSSKDELLEPSINIANTNCSYKCYVCNFTASGDLELLKHLNDSKHKNILATFPRDYIPFIYCPACESDIFEDENMISHLESDDHQSRFFHNPRKSDSVQAKENLLDSVPGSKTIVDELCSEIIRKARKPKTDLKKKNKTTLHFSSEYSKMFLEMGPSNIFNVAQGKMQKLKSGAELLLLLNNERLCLVCYQKIPNNTQLLYEHLFNKNHIHKLDKLINDDLPFENFRDQFSDLALAKEFLKEVNDEIVFCFVCKEEIINDDNTIHKHVVTNENHLIKCQDQKQLTQEMFKTFNEQLHNAWYIVQRFWCQLCNGKFEYDIDFVQHLTKKKHLTEVKKLQSKKIEVCLDVCIPCASMSLGNHDTYTMHCEDTMHKYLVKSKDYAVPEMLKPAMNLLNNVEETVENFVLQSDAATLLEKNIDLVLKFLEQAVKSHYPEAKAYVFGSRASYLAFSSSDVDIFLDCGNAYNGKQLLSKSREYLLNSQICFESQPDVWELKEVLLKVRAPIIKVRHRELGLDCDVSFTNGLTVEKTRIVRLFMISYPLCRKLVLYLKKWLSTCLLTDTQGLTTFGITWFVIFYLQQIKILPSIKELMKNKSQSKIVGGWETGIALNIPIKNSSMTFKELLTGFFEFYANYDYRTYVISPLMGNSLRKLDFTDDHIPYLPIEMASYSRYIKTTLNPEVFRIDSPLCLQDPIDLVQNITRSVSKLILRCFIQYCRSSAEVLSSSQ